MPDDQIQPPADAPADALQANAAGADPNDQLDVPEMMYPAEVDARGDAVNTLREEKGLSVPDTHDEDRGASYA
jgi:hypothetical protein